MVGLYYLESLEGVKYKFKVVIFLIQDYGSYFDSN